MNENQFKNNSIIQTDSNGNLENTVDGLNSENVAVSANAVGVFADEKDVPNSDNPQTLKGQNEVDVSDAKTFSQKFARRQRNFSAKMPSWMKKCSSFVSAHWLYFAAPLLIFALFMGILYSMDIYPFGTDNMSNYDLLAQIVPFYEHFYDVVEGKSGLFYSPAIAGGADVFGTLAYCAVSPFTFIFLFFGKTSVYNAISFVLPLKLSCVACSAIYFINRNFRNIPEHIVLIISLLYAYCGYMYVANTYVNWVDFLIYMPFVFNGFIKLVKEKKIRYFAVSYALMIYACFSIACFALLLIFLLFIAYVLIVAESGERWELFSKMCISLVLAVGIALPIMVPSFFAYMRSGRNTGLFQNLYKELSSDHLGEKMTYVLADSAFLFLTLAYFLKNRFKTKVDRFLFASAVLIMAPVLIDEVCNLLNAGSYMSYALRFGFLNSTFSMYVACRLLNEVKEKSVNKWINATICTVFGLGATFLIIFILKLNDIIINAEGSSLSEFSGGFAHSRGGILVVYQIALLIFALISIAALLLKFRLVKYKHVSFILIGVFAVQIAFYNIHLIRGNAFNPLRYDQYNAIFEKVDEYDDRRYYKVKDNNSSITNDAALNTHTNSYGVFSSVIDNDNFVATNFFNYEGNRTNSIECSGGTFFSDCLLGYKYYYVHTDDTRSKYSLSDKQYMVKLDETAQPNFCAYENIACFPNSYTVSGGELKMDSDDYLDNINELYKFLGGEGDAFVEVDFSNESSDGDYKFEEITDPDTGEIVYSFKMTTNYYGYYYFDADFPSGYEVGYSTSTSDDKISLNYSSVVGDFIEYGYNRSGVGQYNLSVKSIGGQPLDRETVLKCIKGKVLPNDKIIALSESLKARQCDYTQTRNKFTIQATADDENTYVVLNYVSIKGFEATVNGHKAEIVDNGVKFLMVKLDEGENTVTFSYKSPYYKYIAVGVILGVIAIVAVWLIHKKYPVAEKKITPFISVLGIVLGIGIFGFFIVFPTGIFAEKLVVLLTGIK